MSKAFDTVKHSSLMPKYAQLLPNLLYIWQVDFYTFRTHTTIFEGKESKKAAINASVIQGSVIGPISFAVNMIDLHPIDPNNFLFKYADDCYLITTGKNGATIPSEIENINSWCKKATLN